MWLTNPFPRLSPRVNKRHKSKQPETVIKWSCDGHKSQGYILFQQLCITTFLAPCSHAPTHRCHPSFKGEATNRHLHDLRLSPQDVRYLGYLEFELESRTVTHRAVTMRNRCHLCSSLCSGGSSRHDTIPMSHCHCQSRLSKLI